MVNYKNGKNHLSLIRLRARRRNTTTSNPSISTVHSVHHVRNIQAVTASSFSSFSPSIIIFNGHSKLAHPVHVPAIGKCTRRKKQIMACPTSYSPHSYPPKSSIVSFSSHSLSSFTSSHSPSLSTNNTTQLSAKPSSQHVQNIVQNIPPYPIRIALVASTTALATPAFPVIGFLQLFFRTIGTRNKSILSHKYPVTASIGTITSFGIWTLGPISYGFAPLLLPFAIANGLCAGAIYGVLEFVLGNISTSSTAAATVTTTTTTAATAAASKTVGTTTTTSTTIDTARRKSIGIGLPSITTSTPPAPPTLPTPSAPKSKSILHKNPLLTAGAIGATTGIIAPTHLYGPSFYYLYGIDGINDSIHYLMDLPFMTEICGTTGLFAGIALYPLLLHYPMNGIQGVHWITFSGGTLGLLGMALYGVYSYHGLNDNEVNDGTSGVMDGIMSSKYQKIIPYPSGSYCPPTMVPLINSIVRYNVELGHLNVYSLSTHQWMGPPPPPPPTLSSSTSSSTTNKDGTNGTTITTTNTKESKVTKLSQQIYTHLSQNKSPSDQTYTTMDDPILALLHHTLDSNLASRYPKHVVSVVPLPVLKSREDSMMFTDWTVKCIVERGMGISGGMHRRLKRRVSRIGPRHNDGSTTTILKEFERYPQLNKKRTIAEKVSPVVELLFLLQLERKGREDALQKQQSSSSKSLDASSESSPTNSDSGKGSATTTTKSTPTSLPKTIPVLEKYRGQLDEDKLEQWIRKKAPGIVLFTKEEQETGDAPSTTKMVGQSVESQLRAVSWFDGILYNSSHGYKRATTENGKAENGSTTTSTDKQNENLNCAIEKVLPEWVKIEEKRKLGQRIGTVAGVLLYVGLFVLSSER